MIILCAVREVPWEIAPVIIVVLDNFFVNSKIQSESTVLLTVNPGVTGPLRTDGGC